MKIEPSEVDPLVLNDAEALPTQSTDALWREVVSLRREIAALREKNASSDEHHDILPTRERAIKSSESGSVAKELKHKAHITSQRSSGKLAPARSGVRRSSLRPVAQLELGSYLDRVFKQLIGGAGGGGHVAWRLLQRQ
ncbi:hypothetical protein NUW54_g10463 [Trametes sanguinea]|uniref:Uncharacterized protein n=1 Tax=Trametes sanguinea TaxID=158606 RepID=A0ACC1P040_9APHY|nr:hypothetical protein NUW54_g10463 [Trametes sanguinea]